LSGDRLPELIASYPELGNGTRARLRVALQPRQEVALGQAFWDLHSQSIEYHIVPHRPYHSYIEGDNFRIETDRGGRPVLVEIREPQNGSGGPCPPAPEPALVQSCDLRFLDLRIRSRSICAAVDFSNSLSFIKLLGGAPVAFGAVATGAVWGIDANGFLSALWLTDVQSDPSGLRRGRWRRGCWTRTRRMAIAAGYDPKDVIQPVTAAKENVNSTIFA
jgi:hypothetical protein